MLFHADTHLSNVARELFEHIGIDDCDQPIVRSVKVVERFAHAVSLSWRIADKIFDTLKLDKAHKAKVWLLRTYV